MKKFFSIIICLVFLVSCGQAPVSQETKPTEPDYEVEEKIVSDSPAGPTEKVSDNSETVVLPDNLSPAEESTSEPPSQTVSIVVLGLEGETIFSATADYREEITVFELLTETAKEQNIPVDFSGTKSSPYVTSICGLKEKEHGPSSGWVYTVNNEMVMVSSGKMKLNPGDIVQWKYITKF